MSSQPNPTAKLSRADLLRETVVQIDIEQKAVS
jgi:hypothetical protein